MLEKNYVLCSFKCLYRSTKLYGIKQNNILRDEILIYNIYLFILVEFVVNAEFWLTYVGKGASPQLINVKSQYMLFNKRKSNNEKWIKIL